MKLNCRKFSIYRFLDELVWLLVAFGPFILYAVYLANEGVTDPVSWREFCSIKLDFVIGTGNLNGFESSLIDMFETGSGLLDLYDTFSNSILLDFMVHFFAVQFMHVMFDLLCFIPKWCHEMMHNTVYRSIENE